MMKILGDVAGLSACLVAPNLLRPTYIQNSRTALKPSVILLCWLLVVREAARHWVSECLSGTCLLDYKGHYTHQFNKPLPGTTRLSQYQKRDSEWLSGSGISWAIYKSASRSTQITTPAPHHSVFYRPDALPAAQPTASKHWRHKRVIKWDVIVGINALRYWSGS